MILSYWYSAAIFAFGILAGISVTLLALQVRASMTSGLPAAPRKGTASEHIYNRTTATSRTSGGENAR